MDGRRKKRPIHNLKGQLVSAKVRLPQGVPMKDVEILVYCFNHITHPLVALRIMDNGWRPSEICEILNSHRDIEPPYLANTVTNKLKAVMARGKALYGENWPPADRAPRVDQSIDDLRINDGKAQDCEIRAFAEGIKAHPYGHNAGLFTKCVKYCANNNDDTKVSEIHKIVEILNQLDNMSYEEKVEAGVVKKKREKGDVGGLGDDGKLDPELGLEE
ncbi:hypothetical protein K432DRAFT_115153 [Lepidopterella palustris CBS 459.81]|uniref:Uncharacterized protein n=1 Tax=Lepidopterella palustris CBS 459.81 TaxID=1314670 RepID=A0A8E2JCK7_9PEZI|nr:hypothetical protein K432DRAFT_115153 [Lepidopterella palustris CBS 459.81]